MVQIAKEDTYATEDVGHGVLVRRLVKAGQPVPDHYNVDGKTETVEAAGSVGYSARDITARVTGEAAETLPAEETEPESTSVAASAAKHRGRSKAKDDEEESS